MPVQAASTWWVVVQNVQQVSETKIEELPPSTQRYRRQKRNNLGDPNVQWWKTKEDGASGEPEPTGGERSHSAYTTVMSRAQTRKVEVALSRWNQKDEMSMLMCSVR